MIVLVPFHDVISIYSHVFLLVIITFFHAKLNNGFANLRCFVSQTLSTLNITTMNAKYKAARHDP